MSDTDIVSKIAHHAYVNWFHGMVNKIGWRLSTANAPNGEPNDKSDRFVSNVLQISPKWLLSVENEVVILLT